MPTCPQCREEYPPNAVVCPRDGVALDGDEHAGDAALLAGMVSERSDLLIGATLAGRYRVTARIGLGGMGAVYRGTHAVIGREVAIKVLHERYAERREVAARLMNEARLASAIRNEHIVDIFDFGETGDGRTFVVMELLAGESLAQLLRREGPLREERAVDIALQAADALGAAHARGIVHRDVKPENLFVARREGAEDDEAGRDFVKVLDFGISKAMRADDELGRLTQTGMVLGTPLYMSPEQARGDEDIDHRIDVYALGVILYECLTGEVPFRGSNYLGILADVRTRDAVPPRELRPELSPAVERVVLRAMAKERAQRYPSMAELATALRRARDGEPLDEPEATHEPGALPPARLRRKRRVLLGTIAAIALVVASGTALLARHALAPATISPVPAAKSPASAPSPPVAAPSPAPPAPTVAVQVRSRPTGADIYDGPRLLGQTPRVIDLPRGDEPLTLRLHLAGYRDADSLVVPAEDMVFDVELQPAAPRRPIRPKKPPPNVQASSTSPRDPLPAPSPYK